MTKHWDDYFVSSTALSARSSDESSISSGNNDLERWVHESVVIHGCRVSAFALLSGFGKGTSFLRYLSQHLVSQLLQSAELDQIVKELTKIQANTNMKYIDDKIIELLKSVFLNVNADYMERYESQQRKNSRMDDELCSWDTIDTISLSDPDTNGCSAILSVIVKDRLFTANCGNSIAVLNKKSNDPKESYLFQLSALHEDTTQIIDLHALPSRCFGSYNDGSSGKIESTCEPFVVSQGIALDHTIQFLMFSSPLAVKIATQLNIDNLDNVNTYLVSLVMDDFAQTKSISKSLNNVVQRLVDHYNQMSNSTNARPSIAIAYVDLHNDNATDQAENVQEQAENANDANTVLSEVDWSEFNQHEARDLFTALVNSLKQKELNSISEH